MRDQVNGRFMRQRVTGMQQEMLQAIGTVLVLL